MICKPFGGIQLLCLGLVLSFTTMTSASEITGLDGSVTAVAFSPDGKILAAADGGFDVSFWDVATGAKKGKGTGLASGTSRVCWSPDDKTVYGTTGNDWIALNAATGQESLKVKAEMTRTAPKLISLSLDGKTIVAAGRGVVKFWNTANGQSLGEFEAHPNYGIISVAFSPDGRSVVTTCNDRVAQITRVESGEAVLTLSCSGRAVAAEFSPDGKIVFVADQSPLLHQFDATTGADQPAPPMSRPAKQIAVSSDGAFVACAASSLELWSRKENRWIIKRIDGSSGAMCVAISPDSRLIACGDLEGRIHVWTSAELLAAK